MLYELTVDQEHINLIKKALKSYICSIYEGLDAEVVDVDKSHEDIKVLSDMLAVLKGQSNYKQTSESVGLMWMKEIDLEEMSHDSGDERQNFKEKFERYRRNIQIF